MPSPTRNRKRTRIFDRSVPFSKLRSSPKILFYIKYDFLENPSAVLIVVKHIKAGAGWREQHHIAGFGQISAILTASGIEAPASCRATILGKRFPDFRGSLSDQDSRFDMCRI
jgi:hypothetical protein